MSGINTEVFTIGGNTLNVLVQIVRFENLKQCLMASCSDSWKRLQTDVIG
jgi:hypothetical protein